MISITPISIKERFEKWKIQNQAKIKGIKIKIISFRNSIALIGLFITVLCIIIAIFSPFIMTHPEHIGASVDLKNRLKPPSFEYYFGTDDMGRDIFSRVIYGTRISLIIGIFVVTLAGSIGTIFGLLSGFIGGNVDEIIMRITDVFLSIPPLILAILVATLFGKGLFNTILAISVTRWCQYTRLIRGITLSIKEQQYIEAARMTGCGKKRIIFSHILPNCVSPIIVQSTYDVGRAILTASALGFIGLGAIPPSPEWGLMISTGRLYIPKWWWFATFPGLAIFFTVLGFNLLGDGLRDILDPRHARRIRSE